MKDIIVHCNKDSKLALLGVVDVGKFDVLLAFEIGEVMLDLCFG